MGKEFNHLMLDIETMGNKSYASIVSIAAVEFDIENGLIGRSFYEKIDLQSCIDIGLIVDASTIIWWMRQSDKARAEFTDVHTIHIIDALKLFSNFCNSNYFIWANSPRFDCAILQNAYDKAGIKIPWDFRKERCIRTLVSLAPEIKDNYKSIGTTHNAFDDCINQINIVYRSANHKF